MQPQKRAALLTICGLILATLVIMKLSGHADAWIGGHAGADPSNAVDGPEGLRITGNLVQDKILRGSSGQVSLALTLTAPLKAPAEETPRSNVDLVVVLDRSGSMNGQKIEDARRAILHLMGNLAPGDRLALVTYANNVATHAGLTPMTTANRDLLRAEVEGIMANGGTNLGAGLKRGMAMAAHAGGYGNVRRIILISDGLANQGITNPHALGTMAAAGLEKSVAVSTVGLGQEFNEHLMTHLADNGGGSYYYLENPAAFAAVFQKEYHLARGAAASSIRVELPLPEGARLVDAGGYPIQQIGSRAVFHPGGLRYGQSRKLYLTLQLPTNSPRKFHVGNIRVGYRQGALERRVDLADRFTVACVDDADDVMASIRKDAWGDQVVQADFGRLKEEVAADIKAGRSDQARLRIQTYRQEKAAINAVVDSARVSQNLEREVEALNTYVEETFAGPAPAVAAKQKKNAKALQYEGYRERRDKQ
ncbi:MAG: VWA domain-containing protein [Desulfobacterales bacterium]|nr:VWA domain-containing protein [Desulfobacterales bacterium]